MPTIEQMREQAMMLARENREAEPSIERIFWFPDTEEIRLVELTPQVPASGDRLQPFYFRAAPTDGIIAPSGIALIRPDEYRRLRLPEGWPTWDQAEELPLNNGNRN
jgi:hypothetical protein